MAAAAVNPLAISGAALMRSSGFIALSEFTHNLGTSDFTLAIWGSDNTPLMPGSVVQTSINVLTLGFDVAATGRVVVIG
jgi:hypothetical protein